MSADPTQPMSTWYGQGGPVYRRRRRRWPMGCLATLIVIVVLLVVGDRVALAVTENEMASQFQQQGFPAKPHVTIQGFPFLTQLAQRDFRTVLISASDVTKGPLEIDSLNATIHGMHINSMTSATIDQINGTALINFAGLARAGGVPQGITLTAGSDNTVRATADVGGQKISIAEAQLTKTGPTQLHVHFVEAGDLPLSMLGSLADFTVTVPKLPAGLTIQSVQITQQGALITIAGYHTTLSE